MLGETAAPPPSSEEEEDEDSLSYVDDAHDKDYVAEKEERKANEVARRPRAAWRRQGRKKKKEAEEEEDVTVGDVFALEMELNRENKKMMKVRRGSSSYLWAGFLQFLATVMCVNRGVVMAASCPGL